MKPKKKNNVFTFFCSFLPGAAEMYMGFMRMGISLMALFFLTFMIPAMFNANDVFICLAFTVWFYGFFHARNLSACDDEAFELLKDQFIWEEFIEGKPVKISEKIGRKWIAGILIFLGMGILWSNFRSIIYNLIPDELWEELYPIVANIPGTVIAVIIIIVGVRMILGKKEELLCLEEKKECIGTSEEAAHGEEN